MKKNVLFAALLAVFFAWSCKKEKHEELITPVVSNSSGQLKSTEVLIFADSVWMADFSLYSPNYMRGESLKTPSGPKMNLSSVKVRLSKFGSPTGWIKMLLYKTTGIWGTGIQKPTGNPLATSDSINVATGLTTTGQEKVFTFTGVNKYLMNPSTSYFVVLYFKGGNSTNYIKISMDTFVHTYGNSVMWAPSMGNTYGWVVQPMKDFYFWVYAY